MSTRTNRPGQPFAGVLAFFRELGLLPNLILGAAVVVLIGLQIPAVVDGTGEAGEIARNILSCLALVGMGVGSYVAWPSRWNIPAHLQVAFAIPAYVLPLLGLDVFGTWDNDLVILYTRLVGYGFVAMTAGTLIGRVLVDRFFGEKREAAVRGLVVRAAVDAPRRVLVVSVASVIVLIVCFAVMGFVPALTADPGAAKFFKGIYHEPYEQVSIPYRFVTTLIPVLLPIVGVYAWTRRRKVWWIVILAATIGVMLLCLLREPAVSGALIALGVVLAYYKRFFIAYLAALIAVYVAGSALYVILALLGFSQYESVIKSGQNLMSSIASGAPDIPDQLKLLAAWLPNYELTLGRTFVGGLIPGNFEWNPSVWTLTTLNPTTDIEEIRSGGLRLPAPVWGYVSFDWVGAIVVALLSGVIIGILARGGARLLPGLSLETAAMLMVVYLAAVEVFPAFYRLSYLSVLGLILVLVLFFVRVPARWQRRRSGEPALSNGDVD
ncbi:hypothetical protein HD599_003435 [Conyzicola lurida]|uniref:Oligosaccharide repeat unit polymerase n=1 Tax=Conyzicola lurida TaxID=1172621 RepID=A0A841AT40_9MICO|nr:hypothetical protein [Conyzicola lurida]MBB5845112.1 hypothetical protein [Conyzicola lurida]